MSKFALFSQEILNRIIDHLYDDIESLSACTQVASAWLPRSRYNLFDMLAIDTENCDMEELVQLVDATPNIAKAIHDLHLSGSVGTKGLMGDIFAQMEGGMGGLGGGYGGFGGRRRKRPAGGVRAPLLKRLFSCLSSLQEIRLSALKIDQLEYRHRQQYFDVPGSAVDDLTFVYFRVPIEDFIRTLAAFSRISVRKTLFIKCLFGPLTFTSEHLIENQVSRIVTTKWKVRRLSVPESPQDFLWVILSRMLDPNVLYHLDMGPLALDCFASTSSSGFRTLLQQAGASLRILDWDISSWFSGSTEHHVRFLENCPNLEVVRLNLGASNFSPDDDGDREALSKFPGDVLDHLPQTVKVVLLSIGEVEDDRFALVNAWVDTVDGANLEAKLPKFPKLTQFAIGFEPEAFDPSEIANAEALPEASQQSLRKHLPKLDTAGKLRFPLSAFISDCVRCANIACKSRVDCPKEHGVEYYESL